jgi:predicted nuclease of predicted toxin-antitoxin system
MPLRFLLDENQRGLLWRYIRRHNASQALKLDVVRLGDIPDLPLGATDPEIIRWAEREGCIMISADRATLASHLHDHIRAGGRSPGIFLIRAVPVKEIVEFLALVVHASEPSEWENQITFIP